MIFDGGSGSTTAADGEVECLAEDYFQAYLQVAPVFATTLGFRGYEDRVEDPSRAADARWVEQLRAFERRGAAIDPAGLGRAAAVTRAVLMDRLRLERDSIAAATGEVSVSASVGGDLSMVLSWGTQVSLPDEAAVAAYVRRIQALGGYFDALGLRYLQAKGDGRTPVAAGVRAAVRQLENYLSSRVEDDPFLQPILAAPAAGDGWSDKTADALRDCLRPALGRLRSVWADELLPVARGDDRIGLCHVPGGEQAYDAMVRLFTTTSLTGQEIHQLGLGLVAELGDEVSRLGASVFGTGEPEEVLQRVRSGEGPRFEAAQQVLDHVDAACRRAEQALPGWFKDYGTPACEVRALDPHQARGGNAAYYMWPPVDGSRPGVLWVNTFQAENRPMAGFESLAFHEGVPGHHLQASVAAEGDLPAFRRYRRLPAHSEGWGLYVEGLADEMGLYSTPAARLGMQVRALMRAARLVVDTGIHCMGWTRNQALEYLQANSDLPQGAVDNEIERYTAVPGQALSYMIGRIRIEQLRERARTALGPSFDIAEFHDRVLADGSMPLDVLDASIAAWVKDQQ